MIMERVSVYSGETEAREKSEAMVGVKNLEEVGGKWEKEASTLVDLGERSANGEAIHFRKWGHALEEGGCLGELWIGGSSTVEMGEGILWVKGELWKGVYTGVSP